MKLPGGVEPFYGPLESIQRLLKKFNDRGVIIGGIAASLLGKPRYTVDVGAAFLISIEEIPQFIEAAKAEGIAPRIQNAEEFARKNRVLLLKHTATETDLDISLGFLPFEQEMVERSVIETIGRLSIRLPTPEDLIITKAVAHRPKDLEDIRTIVDKNPNLDVARIKQWVKQFAGALEMPNLWEDMADLFK
jgi:hypothetical protein